MSIDQRLKKIEKEMKNQNGRTAFIVGATLKECHEKYNQDKEYYNSNFSKVVCFQSNIPGPLPLPEKFA